MCFSNMYMAVTNTYALEKTKNCVVYISTKPGTTARYTQETKNKWFRDCPSPHFKVPR
jgi:hypothetical protein